VGTPTEKDSIQEDGRRSRVHGPGNRLDRGGTITAQKKGGKFPRRGASSERHAKKTQDGKREEEGTSCIHPEKGGNRLEKVKAALFLDQFPLRDHGRSGPLVRRTSLAHGKKEKKSQGGKRRSAGPKPPDSRRTAVKNQQFSPSSLMKEKGKRRGATRKRDLQLEKGHLKGQNHSAFAPCQKKDVNLRGGEKGVAFPRQSEKQKEVKKNRKPACMRISGEKKHFLGRRKGFRRSGGCQAERKRDQVAVRPRDATRKGGLSARRRSSRFV